MPEIKHNFTSGKMNKDLDERLIPDGEYRDAMNVQVSTSEGSDVGTIQNILPNNYGCTDESGGLINQLAYIDNSVASTVGSISDEKNDSLYWFISGLSSSSFSNTSAQSMLDILGNWQAKVYQGKTYLIRDLIMEAKIGQTSPSVDSIESPKPTAECKPVFSDVWGFVIQSEGGSGASEYLNVRSQSLANLLQPGWMVASLDSSGNIIDTDTVESIVEYNNTNVSVSPEMDSTTGYSFYAYYDNVSFGTRQQTSGTGNWEYTGEIFLPLDYDPVDGVYYINTNPVFNQSYPASGDLMATPVNNTSQADAQIGFFAAFNQSVQESEIIGPNSITTTSHPAYGTKYWYKFSSDQNIAPISSSGQSYLNVYPYDSSISDLPGPNATLLTSFSNQELEVSRLQTTQSPSVSGINNFGVAQNLLLASANIGDRINWSYAFPAEDDEHQSAEPMCIHDLTLAEPAAYVPYSFPPQYTNPVPGEIIISEWDSANNICTSNIIYARPDPGGSFGNVTISVANVQETVVKVEDTIVTTTPFSSEDLALMFFNPNRVLNFNIDKLVTATNIVDNLLFWTDGNSEPKKINVNRSKQGTDSSQPFHTEVVNPFVQTVDGYVPAREEHVTVVKKSPNKNIVVEIEEGEGIENAVVATIFSGALQPNEFQGSENGKNTEIVFVYSIANPVDYELNDVLRFSTNSGELSSGEYELRAAVTNIRMITPNDTWANGALGSIYRVEILNVKTDANLNSSNATWYSIIENTDKKIFERKLPRFSYRYKYLDNEYSSIGPFTDVIFNPGSFQYHPVEAYNKAMVNNIKSITLKDFVSSDMPADVKQIDLLYKNDTDPNIYIIDTITPKDFSSIDENAWNADGTISVSNQILENYKFATSGSYKIKTENIFATLPSNQSLRSWDNVPKKALAQEVTGNRVVYGNYTQGYNLTSAGSDDVIVPEIDISLQTRNTADASAFGKKSIKSLRSYEVGVVWGDKYGRETPVISPSSGSLNVPKSRSEQSNFIALELKNSPDWADYYKFYIKETSNEYYNLALGRVYEDGEDKNVWLAFPSVDRNKVDEDTYLILKKGQGEDAGLILEDARYKIVAIENEAPDQIKTVYTKVLRTSTDDSRIRHSCLLFGGSLPSGNCNLPDGGANAPTPGRLNFTIKKNHWSGDYNATGIIAGQAPALSAFAMGLTNPRKILEEVNANPRGLDELWVGFSKELPNQSPEFSTKYRVVDVVDEDGSLFYDIKLASPILSQDSDFTDGTLKDDNLHVHFWKRTIENKPEFDGRFFVKIHRDQTVLDNLLLTTKTVNNFAIISSVDIFKLQPSQSTFGTNTFYTFPSATPSHTYMTEAQWKNKLKFGTNSVTDNWFIDGAPFAGQQPLLSESYSDSITQFPALTTTMDSCDRTSSVVYKHFIDLWWGELSNPSVWINQGDGLSKGIFRMKANHESSGDQYLDLSYSQLEPHGPSGRVTNYNLNWKVGDPSEPNTSDQAEVVSRLVPNQQFKIKGNETVYKILGVTKYRLYNYMGRRTPHPPKGSNFLATQPLWSDLHIEQTKTMSRSWNRRLTYRIKYELDPQSPAGAQDFPIGNNSTFNTAAEQTSIDMLFLTEFTTETKNKISLLPAIFETEPKEDLDLNLYYEASSNIPTLPLSIKNRHMFIPIGSTIEPEYNHHSSFEFTEGIFVVGWKNDQFGNDQIVLSDSITTSDVSLLITHGAKFVRDDGSYTTANIISGSAYSGSPTGKVNVLRLTPTASVGLGWYNCFSFNNGVESNRIGDTFNKPFTTNGAKASTVLEEAYGEEHRKYGLIYSGIYNSNSGVNNLNQFIAAEKITKDINPIYGSIQKLHSRNSDLITLCEDKILKILANKDAVFNADGNPQLTATDKVLGQTIPFAGEYGISTNPESFASESYRAYFTDKVRGTVMRLSKDGLTVISDYGMKDWFRDNLKLYNRLVGSYDDRKDEYNITLKH